MKKSSLFNHTERTDGIVLPYNRGVDVVIEGPETYRVYFPQVLKLVLFLVDGCTERANKPGRLQKHFTYQHWKSKVSILQEVLEPLPRCDLCGIHFPETRVIKHRYAKRHNRGMDMRIRGRDVYMVEECRYGVQLVQGVGLRAIGGSGNLLVSVAAPGPNRQ